jgi:hypothetical protein
VNIAGAAIAGVDYRPRGRPQGGARGGRDQVDAGAPGCSGAVSLQGSDERRREKLR